MSYTELIYALAEVVQESFSLLEMAGNNFNVLIIVVGTILTAIWVRQMIRDGKEAQRNGTLQ